MDKFCLTFAVVCSAFIKSYITSLWWKVLTKTYKQISSLAVSTLCTDTMFWFVQFLCIFCCSLDLRTRCQQQHLPMSVSVCWDTALFLPVKAAEWTECSPTTISAGSHLQQSSCKHKMPNKEAVLKKNPKHLIWKQQLSCSSPKSG